MSARRILSGLPVIAALVLIAGCQGGNWARSSGRPADISQMSKGRGPATMAAVDPGPESADEGTWAKLTRPFRRPDRIPLPRTDQPHSEGETVDLVAKQQNELSQF